VWGQNKMCILEVLNTSFCCAWSWGFKFGHFVCTCYHKMQVATSQVFSTATPIGKHFSKKLIMMARKLWEYFLRYIKSQGSHFGQKIGLLFPIQLILAKIVAQLHGKYQSNSFWPICDPLAFDIFYLGKYPGDFS